MYFVDRTKIEQTLSYMEQLLQHFSEVKDWSSKLYTLALERMAHLLIESILDVGNAMIDGFIMRDPGSYEDIIDILEDEKVISSVEAKSLKVLIVFRKALVQDYIKVDHLKLLDTMQREMVAIQSFPANVRGYLENELGPVSAFIPKS